MKSIIIMDMVSTSSCPMSMLCLDPLPVIYPKDTDRDKLNMASPTPLDEHCIPLDDSILTEMGLDAIQSKILPVWGATVGAQNMTKTIVTRADVLTHLQTMYDGHLPHCALTPDDCASFRAEMHSFYKDSEFYKKFNFMNWNMAEPMNHSADFMGINAISQYATPVMHAMGPLYVMFIPLLIFIVDLICGKDMETCSSKYICHVFHLLNKHFIGKRIFQLDVPIGITGLLLGLWAVYYIFQGYMQYHQIKKFTKHLWKAAEWIDSIKEWTGQAIVQWRVFETDESWRKMSPAFYQQMDEMVRVWKEIDANLPILPKGDSWKVWDFPKIGNGLVQLYRLYTSAPYMNALFCIPSWLEYMGALVECSGQMKKGQLTKAVYVGQESVAFSKETLSKEKIEEKENAVEPRVYMTNHVHPALSDAVPNSTSLEPSVVLTGENASGKSTCMRSVFANILLSQSIGLGRYSECRMVPYSHFHLYMNIPDVLEKDSLFEAEVRQCKDILDTFSDGGHHFCAFDELFTGTNPLDAETITYAYLHYISTNHPNVQFWLTTHFHDACRKLQEQKIDNVLFCEMKKGYQMTPGISTTANAVSVLNKFHFPEDIVQMAKGRAVL